MTNYGRRVFSYAGFHAWNLLSENMQKSTSTSVMCILHITNDSVFVYWAIQISSVLSFPEDVFVHRIGPINRFTNLLFSALLFTSFLTCMPFGRFGVINTVCTKDASCSQYYALVLVKKGQKIHEMNDAG